MAAASSGFPETKTLKIRRLDSVTLEKLIAELARSPRDCGYAEPAWSGGLLSNHLANRYSTRRSARHCRRLLARLQTARPRKENRRKRSSAEAPLVSQSPGPRPPLMCGSSCDRRNKQIALKRIQRLCAAGLPMATFAMTLFDLVGDAIPHGEIRLFTADYPNHRWFTNVDISSWGSTFSRMLALPPRDQGTTMDPVRLAQKQLWRHEELEIGRFENSVGYNEFARHLGFHHVITLMLRGADGRLGCFPLWRSRDMKPFTAEDRAFMAAIAEHLNHAVAHARHDDDKVEPVGDEFEHWTKHGLGLVTIDLTGRILAINDAAKAIFYSLRTTDDLAMDAFEPDQIAASLKYIAGVLRRIFISSEVDPKTPAPMLRLLNHRSGYQIRMTGYAADAEAGRAFFVTVESGETRARLKERVKYRYGLNDSQAELLMQLPRLSNVELATRFGIRADTLRRSLRRLADRLELEGQSQLRDFSRNLMREGRGVSTSLPAPGR